MDELLGVVDINALTLFDFGTLFVIGISALLAFMRGLVYEIVALLGLVLAAYGTYMLSPFVLPLIQNYLRPDWLTKAVALAGTFLALALVASIMAQRLGFLLLQNRISVVDHILGFGYGIARGGVVIMLIWLGLTLIVNEASLPAWVLQSQTLPYIRDGAQAILRLLPTQFLPSPLEIQT